MLKLRTYQIGTPRLRGEGLRIGTVRYLPRGVRKQDYARLDYFDVWFPAAAPSRELVSWLRADVEKRWDRFVGRYRNEMKRVEARQAIKLLAEVAKHTPISIGCYCTDENHCHRSILRKLIEEAAEE
jgi:uncharacterized protein YeaO (DUF488 family)